MRCIDVWGDCPARITTTTVTRMLFKRSALFWVRNHSSFFFLGKHKFIKRWERLEFKTIYQLFKVLEYKTETSIFPSSILTKSEKTNLLLVRWPDVPATSLHPQHNTEGSVLPVSPSCPLHWRQGPGPGGIKLSSQHTSPNIFTSGWLEVPLTDKVAL